MLFRSDLLGKLPLFQAFQKKGEELFKYAAFQAAVPFRAADALEQKLKETGMEQLYQEIELPLVYTLYEMEREGVQVNGEALKSYGGNLSEKITELEREIYARGTCRGCGQKIVLRCGGEPERSR